MQRVSKELFTVVRERIIEHTRVDCQEKIKKSIACSFLCMVGLTALPEDRRSLGEATRYVNQALIGRTAKRNFQAALRQNKWPVDQHIKLGEQRMNGVVSRPGLQGFPCIAGVGPDVQTQCVHTCAQSCQRRRLFKRVAAGKRQSTS